jgi:hypothetical protein
MTLIEGIVIIVSIALVFQLIIHFFPRDSNRIEALTELHKTKLELVKVETRYYEQQKLIEILKEKK